MLCCCYPAASSIAAACSLCGYPDVEELFDILYSGVLDELVDVGRLLLGNAGMPPLR